MRNNADRLKTAHVIPRTAEKMNKKYASVILSVLFISKQHLRYVIIQCIITLQHKNIDYATLETPLSLKILVIVILTDLENKSKNPQFRMLRYELLRFQSLFSWILLTNDS